MQPHCRSQHAARKMARTCPYHSRVYGKAGERRGRNTKTTRGPSSRAPAHLCLCSRLLLFLFSCCDTMSYGSDSAPSPPRDPGSAPGFRRQTAAADAATPANNSSRSALRTSKSRSPFTGCLPSRPIQQTERSQTRPAQNRKGERVDS